MRRLELGEAVAPLSRYREEIGDDPVVLTVGGKATYLLVPLAALDQHTASEETSGGGAQAANPASASDSATSADAPTRPVSIYTDGGCIGNPGPGGYGAIIIDGDKRREVHGGYRRTTNNRMEIMAAIAALAALPGRRTVTLYTDSQYLANAIERGWAKRWRAHGWMRTATDRALNADLWQRLLALTEQHDVHFRWLPGHAGNRENERAHALSVAAARSAALPVDEGYSSG